MTVQICPLHQMPLVPSSQGTGLYCKNKVDGKWCQAWKTGAGQGSSVGAQASPASPAPAPRIVSLTSGDARYIACLAFAAQLFRGGGRELAADAIEVAKAAFASFPND